VGKGAIREEKVNKRHAIATGVVYAIIISAFALTAAGILDLVPGHPTLEIVIGLAFVGFVGVVVLDTSRHNTPQFPDDWKEPVE